MAAPFEHKIITSNPEEILKMRAEAEKETTAIPTALPTPQESVISQQESTSPSVVKTEESQPSETPPLSTEPNPLTGV